MTTAALVELRHARRARRIANIHWVDALYNAYLAAILSAFTTGVLSEQVGDHRVSAGQLATVLRDGPKFVGVLVAIAVGIGLRSGSRGGPFGIEPADVRHVLLAPVPRGEVLRGPAVRQARFMLFASGAAGALAGRLAAQRLPGGIPKWMAAGAGFFMTITALMLGVAWISAGRRLPKVAATLAAGALVTWSIADVAGKLKGSPTAWAGHLALWPLRWHTASAITVAVAVVVLLLGLTSLGGYRIEHLERRSGLVDQLRFAATLQDVRTFMLLRRQLSQEQHRSRPLVGPRRRTRRPIATSWRRDWCGYLRWPLSRVARVMALGVVAGLSIKGAWTGTTPLIVVAGVSLYLAGLDVMEPLAQETDHPDRRDQYPIDNGTLYLRHLPAALVAMLLVCLVGGAAAYISSPTSLTLKLAAVLVPAAALAGTSAATTSVVLGAPAAVRMSDSMLPPEAAGIRVVLRNVWPVALATAGALPIVFARRAFDRHHSELVGSLPVAIIVLVVALFTASWVRFRDGAKAWFRASLDQAAQQGKRP